MSSTPTPARRRPRNPAIRNAGLLLRALTRLELHLERRRSIRALRRLDDHLLKDLGFNRASVEAGTTARSAERWRRG